MKHILFLTALLLAPLAAALHAADGDKPAIKFTGFGPGKMLAQGVQQPGETRADKAVPAHPNALRLSQDVWMISLEYASLQARMMSGAFTVSCAEARRTGP